MKENIYWRSAFFLVGIVVLSLGIAFIIKGGKIGVGSWDVLHMGLADTFGLTIGTWSIIIGLIILAIDGVFRKRLPQIGTYLDMFLSGIFIDIFNFLIPNPHTLMLQIIAFIAGVLLFSFGCGMYMVANLGIGPRDTLMLLLTQKLGWSFGKSRTIMEVTVAILGVFLGGPLGVGTVIMAFTLGPIIQFAFEINQKVYKRCTGKESLLLQSN
ncbi:MAG: YitT family protein [Kurthia sp.]|nr:YitT family protein [Candidatus Kurthia equi]